MAGSAMTVVTVGLIGAGMVAALAPQTRSTLRTPGTLGMGTIMLCVLLAPGFSHSAATESAAILLLLVVAGGAGHRAATRRRWDDGQKATAAATILDAAFMGVALLLMPAHATDQVQASAAVAGAAQLGGGQIGPLHAAGSHLGVAGGLMLWVVLFVWAACAAVLIVPVFRRSLPHGLVHILCSGSMIAAMAVMAV